MHKGIHMGMVLLMAVSALGISTAEAAEAAQQAIVQGKVTSVIAIDTVVKEGDVLAEVDSLVGPVPAARADADGIVKQVLVTLGDTINKQDVVAVVETK